MNAQQLALQRKIEPHLLRISKILPAEYALTLTARYRGPNYKDADIILTDDSLPAAARCLARMAARNNHGFCEVVPVQWEQLMAIVDVAAIQLHALRAEGKAEGWNPREAMAPARQVLRWAAKLDWSLVATRFAMAGDGLSAGLEKRIKRAIRVREASKRTGEFR